MCAYQNICINSPNASDKLTIPRVAMIGKRWRRRWSNATDDCLQKHERR